MAALAADCDREIVPAAAAVLPVSATTRKICSCRKVSLRVPTKTNCLANQSNN
jgi:hypothetical protein